MSVSRLPDACLSSPIWAETLSSLERAEEEVHPSKIQNMIRKTTCRNLNLNLSTQACKRKVDVQKKI